MSLRIVVIGTGGVGGYVGGRMALAGEDVTLISQRTESVERIRTDGLRLEDTSGKHVARPTVAHISGLAHVVKQPFDAVFLCVKSYDTLTACSSILPFLAPDGCIVSMQNGINEDAIASVAGWERTIGAVMSSIGVNAVDPAHIIRTSAPGGDAHTVFRVGRPDGKVTLRVEEVTRALSKVDSSTVTTNLRGERWSKLITNSISHGLSAVTGLTSREIFSSRPLRRFIIAMGAEGVRVGTAAGHVLVPVYGTPVKAWTAANEGDRHSAAQIDHGLAERLERLTPRERPSVSQDWLRGRPTEIEYTNGLLVSEARRLAVPVPTQETVLELVRRIGRGETRPDPGHLHGR